jgi:MFS family permease
MLADRLGARRLTLWAGAGMAIAAFGHAVAPTYALLLGARLLFGLGFGIV